MRVTLVHIAVDGNWTISRPLRQESDDIIEISGEHLQPYVELIAGAEPAPADEDDGLVTARPLANGHAMAAAASFQSMPAPSGNHAPPAIYTAPAVAEYQRPALQMPRATTREERGREERLHEDRGREERPREERTAPPAVNGEAQPAARQDIPVHQDISARPDIYAASLTGTRNRPDRPEPAPSRARAAEEAGYLPGPQGPQGPQGLHGPQALQGPQTLPGPQGPPESTSSAAAAPEPAPPAQLRRLPSTHNGVNQAQTGPMGLAGATPMPSVPYVGQGQGQGLGQSQSQSQGGPGPGGQGQGSAHSAPYSGPQPVVSPAAPPGYQNGSGGVSLSEAVQVAHEEGQEFGGSVARDAPALWLEAVLARKPRMPSDLEARLLQGSALPIDFLLHDEVRHALRRGFWDALERTRR
jgi:hypothetical protein